MQKRFLVSMTAPAARLCFIAGAVCLQLCYSVYTAAGSPVVASSAMQTAEIIVRGQVTDSDNGGPLPGAQIRLKGNPKTGTAADGDGRFTLAVPDNAGTLIISFMGYTTQEVEIAGRKEISIQLKPDAQTLQDVVVVGYGTQSKTKVTGSVAQVGEEVFKNRPIVNIAQGLQGAIPNLNITFGDGQLNRGGSFNIRGFTSINGGAPLILIDGTPGEINLINPEDVESVTVLKDAASAAIYGARAAFGVILVTTKKGKEGKPLVRYTNNFGFGKPIGIPSVINDPLEAARVQNEAYRGYAGTDAAGMPAIIEYLEQRRDDPSLPELGVDASGNFIRGANTDWYDEFYNDKAPFSKNYISISNAKNNTSYYLSLGYEKQKGIFAHATDTYERISSRLKVDTRVWDWLQVFDNIEFNQGLYDAPNKFVSDGGYNVYRYLSLYANPYEAIKTANGNYTIAGMSVFGQLNDAGRTKNKDQVFKNTIGFRTNFLNNRLRLNGDYTYFLTQTRDDVQYFRMKYENRPNSIVNFTNPDYYSSGAADRAHHIINLYAEYEERLGKHHIKGLVGFNRELNQLSAFIARRDENITSSLGSINLTNGITTLSADKSEWALQGIFGRLNYDFDNKYLLEFNGRYDGTSRFAQNDRFGFFPSVSAGWVLSNEPFFQLLKRSINSFKLRASYGSLGNQLVGNYAYISTMSPYTASDLLDLNGQLPLAVRAPNLVPFNLTWETASTLNMGFDMALLKNRLNVGFDWYDRQTKNMLTKGRTLPAVLGTAEPRENAADLSTKGWELSLKWNDELQLAGKPFAYHFSVVLSDSRSFITRFNNPARLLTDFYEGMEVGEIWGYTTLGFFKTDDESAGHADQSRLHLFPGLPKAGDIKFEDTNGDKVISFGKNTVDDPGDLRKIGNTTPRYAYGVNMGFNWYNFSLDLFLQGIGKRDFWPGTEAAVFWGFYNRWNQPVYDHIYNNYWTPENPDAYFPRLRAYEALTTDRSLGAVQTRYLQNAAYLRLKNLSVGYNIPQAISTRAKIALARVFFSGQNLFEWTRLSKAFDPEGLNDEVDASRSNGAGFVYPLQRTFTFGVEINF